MREKAEAGEIPMSPRYEANLRLRRAVIGVQRDELEVWISEGTPVPLEPFLTALDIIEGVAT